MEAHFHLLKLLEQVNAVMGSFYAGDRMEADTRWREELERKQKIREEGLSGLEAGGVEEETEKDFVEEDDSSLYFDPVLGDVIFSSALDGMGFRLTSFSAIYAEKLKIKEGNLRRVLWGDWYLDPKTKRVVTRKFLEKEGKGRLGKLKPLFVQFVLENIWNVYDAVAINPLVIFYFLSDD
jgi:ribosome assembly protein 1